MDSNLAQGMFHVLGYAMARLQPLCLKIGYAYSDALK